MNLIICRDAPFIVTELTLKGKEVLNHCKHNSVHSQLQYNRRNTVSESQLQNTLSAVSTDISKDNPKIDECLNNTYIPEKSCVGTKKNATPINSKTDTECKELIDENKALHKKLDDALLQIDLIQKKIDFDDVLKKNVENENDNNYCIIMQQLSTGYYHYMVLIIIKYAVYI